MNWDIKIARKHVTGSKTGVLMFFDVEVNYAGYVLDIKKDSDGLINIFRASGFRLAKNKKGIFLGFPSSIGKDDKRYPSFKPSLELSEAIQAAAEQCLSEEIRQ
jgi:hypothetical protein